MNAVVEVKEADLPTPVARRNISEAQWRTLKNNLYPGAKSESIVMVWDYCIARKLDPLKKPCHIVPMQVKDAQSGDYIWRDVVMPGIYEYRTTAARTGQYLGHSIPVYGPEGEFLSVKAPEFCDFTVYRWNADARQRAEFPVRVKFSEVVATAMDKQTHKAYVNARWTKAPQQMLTKCAEAAALREAFPDEIGGTATDDELAGHELDTAPTGLKTDPRGDTSAVDWELRDRWVGQITDVLAQDKSEFEIADDLRALNDELMKFDTLAITVFDELSARKIITKARYREYLAIKRAPT